MGDWTEKPWGTDEAADWFHGFWKQDGGIPYLISEIHDFDEKEERYEGIRAAAYLLQVLGMVFVWPVDYSEDLKPTINKAIAILEKMIDPPNDDWGFIESWDGDQDVIDSVKWQIAELKLRLSEMA